MLNLNKNKGNINRYVLCFFIIITSCFEAFAFTPPPVPGDDVGDLLPIDNWQIFLLIAAIIIGFVVHKNMSRSKFTN